MRRAALYARVSTELQEKEQTIQSQLAAITRYADKNGLHHSPALTYADDGYTGTRLDRPGLDELRDHAREGRFDVVVVLCPDRLARRYAYQVLLLEELKRTGVDVLFCERPIDDSPDDQLLLQIQGAMAEYERAKILERCRRGRLHRARRGELTPPAVPYGYTYAARKYGGDGQIRIHEEEGAMVRQIFAWYVDEGATLYSLRQKLAASPWKMRRGKSRWCSATIRQILLCEWYIGRAYSNRRVTQLQDRPEQDGRPRRIVHTERPQSEWIVVPVPRMIDDDVFARAHQRLEDNQRFAQRRQKRPRTYLLKGLLKCGTCGRSYVGHTYTKTPKKHGFAEHHYYSCSGYNSAVSGAERCQNGDFLEEVLSREIAAKHERHTAMKTAMARFPFQKTIESFDFKFQPSIDPKVIKDLATCRFIADTDNILLLGPPGVGKTHLAVGLGLKACALGYRTAFMTAAGLIAALMRAHSEGRLEEKLKLLVQPKLLIVDEIGYLPIDRLGANLFFQLVSRRYERGAILITSNQSLTVWGEVFGDRVIATAILDRLLHHSTIVNIKGESYRLKEKRKAGLLTRSEPFTDPVAGKNNPMLEPVLEADR